MTDNDSAQEDVTEEIEEKSKRSLRRRKHINRDLRFRDTRPKNNTFHAPRDCPGSKKFGFACLTCGYYNNSPCFTIKQCISCKIDVSNDWICGCNQMYYNCNFLQKDPYIDLKIRVYWPKLGTWYSGKVVGRSRPNDEGTHDVVYDDEDKVPVSERLIGFVKEDWVVDE
jgi:hypothetical protein